MLNNLQTKKSHLVISEKKKQKPNKNILNIDMGIHHYK